MKTHTVIDMKITYEPEHMSEEQEKDIEATIKEFIDSVNGRRGVSIKAKRHNVAIENMIDVYGMSLEE